MTKVSLWDRLQLAWRVMRQRPTICFIHAVLEEGYLLNGNTVGRFTFVSVDEPLIAHSHFTHPQQYTTVGLAPRRLLQLYERGTINAEGETEHTQ